MVDYGYKKHHRIKHLHGQFSKDLLIEEKNQKKLLEIILIESKVFDVYARDIWLDLKVFRHKFTCII